MLQICLFHRGLTTHLLEVVVAYQATEYTWQPISQHDLVTAWHLQEASEQANAAALDNRLSSLEGLISSVQQEAAAANSTSSSLQQRFAAMEWRVEQTASSCSATLKTMTAKHERMAGTLAVVKEAANFAEAKCSALGSELARMHRQSARTADMKENKVFGATSVAVPMWLS